MQPVDLVFEGGGAKGMVFVGALQELFGDAKYGFGRLLGTSAGAITAVSLAAGPTPETMLDSLAEKDEHGESVFESFLGNPAPFDHEAVRHSAIRKLLGELNMPFVPDFAEAKIDDWIARQLAASERGASPLLLCRARGLVLGGSLRRVDGAQAERGGADGRPRLLGASTLQQFFAATNVEMTLVAADTSWSRILLLNHRTAPDLPVVWAARMSMSVPLLWQEVEWQEAWGPYRTWNPTPNAWSPTTSPGTWSWMAGCSPIFPSRSSWPIARTWPRSLAARSTRTCWGC